MNHSFFLTALERRGVRLAAGPQAWLLGTLRVEDIMRGPEHPRAAPTDAAEKMISEGTYLARGGTLAEAMPIFETIPATFLPVVRFPGGDQPPEFVGAVFQVDALKALNAALAAQAREEHS